MKIALLQLKVIPGEIELNRCRAVEMVSEAAENADIVVLPEVWTTGYALRNVEDKAETINGQTISSLQLLAQEKRINIVAGSLPLNQNGRIYNSTIVIDSQGQIIADYAKIHMFSLFNEQRFFTAGSKLAKFSLAGVQAGVAICYDLRFPEMFRKLALDGVDIIYVPAEWPAERGEHWRILNQARAIENQVYICAVNCSGEFKGKPFYGHSLFIGPDGVILAEGTNGEEILYGEVEEDYLRRVRQNMSVIKDRRPELYAL